MAMPRLVIKKRMQFIQGKVRPTCYVQAEVDADLRKVLDEHFLNEALFKRAAYANAWPDGAIPIPAAIAPSLGNFLKNDACPEITVKTMLMGQLHQGANAFEMMSFEFIAKLAFENFVALCVTAVELDQELIYESASLMPDAGFSADAAVSQLQAVAAEMAA